MRPNSIILSSIASSRDSFLLTTIIFALHTSAATLSLGEIRFALDYDFRIFQSKKIVTKRIHNTARPRIAESNDSHCAIILIMALTIIMIVCNHRCCRLGRETLGCIQEPTAQSLSPFSPAAVAININIDQRLNNV